MTLAANLLNAVGGTPAIDRDGFTPRYPSYLPHGAEAFEVPLAPFSPATRPTALSVPTTPVRFSPRPVSFATRAV